MRGIMYSVVRNRGATKSKTFCLSQSCKGESYKLSIWRAIEKMDFDSFVNNAESTERSLYYT